MKDKRRSQWMARLVGLTYDWWGFYTRMGTGDRYKQAIPTWPSQLEGVAQESKHPQTGKLNTASGDGQAKTTEFSRGHWPPGAWQCGAIVSESGRARLRPTGCRVVAESG